MRLLKVMITYGICIDFLVVEPSKPNACLWIYILLLPQFLVKIMVKWDMKSSTFMFTERKRLDSGESFNMSSLELVPVIESRARRTGGRS